MRRLAAAASAVAALFCVSAIPAQAAQAEHVPPFGLGKVLARHGGMIRSGPGVNYAVTGRLRNGQVVPLLCRATGSTLRDHRLWYKLNDRPEMWANSVLIGRIGKSPVWCARPGVSVQPGHHHKKHHGMKQQAQHLLAPQAPQTSQMPQTTVKSQNTENLRTNQRELQKLQQELINEQIQQRPMSAPGMHLQSGGKH
ncbi:MAG: SH3 domain-containing protein [Streptomycetaceae bacterium]|nr:SH3 domain-containing protein [Streptomycetaceae bacterium]